MSHINSGEASIILYTLDEYRQSRPGDGAQYTFDTDGSEAQEASQRNA